MNGGKRDQAILELLMGPFDRFAIALVAVAVCGYFAWVYIDCERDPQCHLLLCGKRVCGISPYDNPNNGVP